MTIEEEEIKRRNKEEKEKKEKKINLTEWSDIWSW